jgi:23S rRNA pseudouridine1911/1915/1917 synthase
MEDVTAGPDDAGRRLDQFLAAAMDGAISRSRLKALIVEGRVMLNGAVAREAKRRVAAGDVARIDLPPPEDPEPQPEAIPLSVLYEDDALIVVDKPAGMVIHPGAGNPTGTLVNALIHHCGDTLSGIGGVRRPGIVHRLDKDTSGVMVVAKTDAAHKHLSAQFADHGRTGPMERSYQALVWGGPDRNTGTITTYLGRSGSDRTKQSVVSESQPDARHAVTRFRIETRFGSQTAPVASLVTCILETGRTHQIRVHMAHIGHGLIGDPVYGGRRKLSEKALGAGAAVAAAFPRQALHAARLGFLHPVTGESLTFEAPLPADMAALIVALGGDTQPGSPARTSP